MRRPINEDGANLYEFRSRMRATLARERAARYDCSDKTAEKSAPGPIEATLSRWESRCTAPLRPARRVHVHCPVLHGSG